jgi:predicted small lipoprotein YifL
MNKFTVKSLFYLSMLCCLLSACGNKGPLVKPEEKPAEAEAKQ